MNSKLRGGWVALVTPYNAAGTAIDIGAFRDHAQWVLSRSGDQPCGLIAFGTTGEGPWLEAREQIQAVDAALDLGLADRLLVAVTTQSHPSALELARAFGRERQLPLLVLPPYFYRESRDLELVSYYETIAATAEEQVLAYHIPQFARPVPEDVLKCDAVAGVKDSGGDPSYAEAVTALGKVVLWGSEGGASSVEVPVSGLVSASGNVVPELVQPASAAMERSGNAGQEILDRLASVRRLTGGSTQPARLKRLSTFRHGIDLGPPRLPGRIDGSEVRGEDVLAAAGIDVAGALR